MLEEICRLKNSLAYEQVILKLKFLQLKLNGGLIFHLLNLGCNREEVETILIQDQFQGERNGRLIMECY